MGPIRRNCKSGSWAPTGILTLLGSVANLIVVESARGLVEVGFWDYAKRLECARRLALCGQR